jgi:[ribosomal protein S5]-alanine N-acetyltransferase
MGVLSGASPEGRLGSGGRPTRNEKESLMPPESPPHPWPPEAFATGRLWARAAEPADAEEAWRCYASDPEVTRYLSWRLHEAPASQAEFFASLAPTRSAGGNGRYAWVLRRHADRQLVGSIGIERDGGRIACGYVVGRAFWGHGYATEALTGLLAWVWQDPVVQRVWAYCDLDNPASARVMEKAGLQREGVLRRWHVCPNLGPELRDCIVCAQVR